MSINHYGIKAKLTFLVVFAVIVLGGMGLFAVNSISHLSAEVSFLGNERLPKSDIIGDLRSGTQAVPRFMWLALAFPHGSPERKTYIEKANQNLTLIKESLIKYKTFPITEKGADYIKKMMDLTPSLEAGVQKANQELLNLKIEQDKDAKATLLNEMVPFAVKLTGVIVELSNYNQVTNKEFVIESQREATSIKNTMVAVVVGTSLILLVIGFLFSRSLASSLLNITESVANASEQVSSASQQLSRAADQLSSTAQEQASAVEETSASLTEISGMVQSNTKGAEGANETVRKLFEVGEEAQRSMENLNTVMAGILDSNKKIEKLVKVIEEIGEKTEIIDDIVFKTQLLSFNASVEAERAGEHGRGFAVVAQEVGTLAQLSGKAATDISSIVKVSIKEAEEVARENKTKVENGSELTSETREQMAQVLKMLSNVLDTMNRIVAASHEQSQGVSQISTSVDGINQATQETASTAEEAASASTELSGQSESLMSLVNSLRYIIQGQYNSHTNNQSHLNSTISSTRQNQKNVKNNLSNIKSNYKFNKSNVVTLSKRKITDQESTEFENVSGGWEKL